LQTRKMLLRYTALGPSLAVHWAQESKVGPYLRRRNSLPTELGAATQGDPRKVEELLQEVSNIEDHVVRSDFWLGALQSTLLRLQRNSGRQDSLICDVTGEASSEDLADELLLQQAEAAMERIAPSDRLLEVQFDTETGFGSAVTRSFYAEVAGALQNRATNRQVPMWVEDDSSGGHSSSSGGGASQHLRCRSGLWVRPLPLNCSVREAAERRFRFLGRLVGRALKDGFIVPLPLGEVFFARTLLGQKPSKLHEKRREPLASLPRPGAGCAGELCGALADFAAALRSAEELYCHKRIEAGLGWPSAEELQSWRRSQGRERDFTTRFLAAGATPEPMSFEDYMSLVGVSFLETGLSGAPLCPGGADRAITVENVQEFVELAHAYWCDDGVRGQLTAFREGLDEVIPVECFSAFSALELRDMICGEDSVEWGEQELLDHLRPSGGLTEQSPSYQHLVAVLLDMDQVNRSRFLDFVSSCPRFPPGGTAAAA
ncbi:Ufd4, partial [Symbiodinium pilosum]